MSKKQKITDELNKGTNVEDICTELEVSTGYVYRIKREIDESDGNKEKDIQSEDDNNDDLALGASGGAGVDVEKDDEDLGKKESEGETDDIGRVGGVKKRKRSTKKRVEKEDKDEQKEDKGAFKWMKNQWKKMLLILSALILSIVLMLSFSQMKVPEKSIPITRYPVMGN